MYTLKHGEEKKKEGGETQELHGTRKSGRRIVSGAQRERGGGCEGVLGVPTPASASARTLVNGAEADREAPGAPSAAGAVQTLCTQTRERKAAETRGRGGRGSERGPTPEGNDGSHAAVGDGISGRREDGTVSPAPALAEENMATEKRLNRPR